MRPSFGEFVSPARVTEADDPGVRGEQGCSKGITEPTKEEIDNQYKL